MKKKKIAHEAEVIKRQKLCGEPRDDEVQWLEKKTAQFSDTQTLKKDIPGPVPNQTEQMMLESLHEFGVSNRTNFKK